MIMKSAEFSSLTTVERNIECLSLLWFLFIRTVDSDCCLQMELILCGNVAEKWDIKCMYHLVMLCIIYTRPNCNNVVI